MDWQEWPDVEYGDVFNYLIESPSVYTGKLLKAYKSLDAYNFFASGWVDNVSVTEIQSCRHTYLITALVRHSQKISATPVQAWVATKQDGRVVCGHCTCMAGLGEVCSHIAAILFTVEANTKHKQATTSTSLPCSWLPPTFRSVSFAPIAAINFNLPVHGQKQIMVPSTDNATGSPVKQQKTVTTPAPSEEELQKLYAQLSKSGKPVLLSIVPTHSDSYVPLYESGVLPKPLTQLFSPVYLDLTYPELLSTCEQVFEGYQIELKTQDQSISKLWFQQRAGHVTASKLKAATHTDTVRRIQTTRRLP